MFLAIMAAAIVLIGEAQASRAATAACRDVKLGERWICCVDDDGLLCVPNPAQAATNAEYDRLAPLRAEDFTGSTAVRIAHAKGADEIALVGDGYCERRGSQVSCARSIAAPNEGLLPAAASVSATAIDAGLSLDSLKVHRRPQWSAAEPHLCAIQTDGSIVCLWRWAPRRGEALRVLGTIEGHFTAVATGATIACGLTDRGRVSCWYLPDSRYADYNKSFAPQDTLKDVAAGRRATAIAAWGNVACAAMEDGEVLCWLYAHAIQPRSMQLGNVKAVAVGGEAGCAILASGEVRCWSMIGGASRAVEAPRALADGTRAQRLVMSRHEACAVVADGLRCWRTKPPGGPAPPPPPKPPPPPVVEPPPAPVVVTPAPPRRWMSHLAVPFSYGYGVYWTRQGRTSGSWLRFRAEVLFGPEEEIEEIRKGRLLWAAGFYAELGWHPVTRTKQPAYGAGATAIFWLRNEWVLAPSVGWYSQSYGAGDEEQGVAAGVFLGAARYDLWGPLLVPIGVRIEGRWGLGGHGERALMAAGDLDALGVALIPAAVVLLAKADWRF